MQGCDLIRWVISPLKKGFDPLRASTFYSDDDALQRVKPLFHRAVTRMAWVWSRVILRRTFLASLVIGLFCQHALQAAEAPASWVDDAQLNDLQFVGSKFVVAVGEHGAIWKSEDGGQTWNRLKCGYDISLRSVCFLSDQIGWVAGGDIAANQGLDRGFLLATSDGGKRWFPVGVEPLPALSYVRFFGLNEGVVVGAPTASSPAGIYKTDDAGQTWRGVQGEAPQGWKASCFLEPEMGIVAGVNSRVSLMGGEQLFQSKLLPQGYRSVRAIRLLPSEVGWLAGDGGLVLKTVGGGVIWEAPPTQVPDELRQGMDFRAVEVREDKVWLAGSPGSVIWHSPDGGRTWKKQLTGQTAPMGAVRFANEKLGLAVGAFGVILRTDDGGQTWQGVRGNGRHAALLELHARPGQTNAALITSLSGERGYRSAVWVTQRNDLGPLATSTNGETRLQSAVQKSGGNAAEVYWQLPLAIPGIEYSSDKLLAEWQRQTEGRLGQTLIGVLVRQIRTWQPHVVVLDQPSPDDAASQLLYDASLKAIEQAGDESRFTEQSEITGLPPWIVDRIYVRLAPGATGDAHVDLDEFLPHLKTTTRLAASTSIGLLETGRVPRLEAVESPRAAYRWVDLSGQPARDTKNAAGPRTRDFFGGQAIASSSATRREWEPYDTAQEERLMKLMQKHRNINAIARKSFDDPRIAGQMIAQIDMIVDGMDPHQGAIALRDMADEYRKRSQWENVESTYVELIHRYPNEPESLDAMRWLLQLWCSTEVAWQRSRTLASNSAVATSKTDQRAQYVQQAVGQQILGDDGVQLAAGTRDRNEIVGRGVSSSPARLNVTFDPEGTVGKGAKAARNGRMKISQDNDWRSETVRDWQARAIELSKKIESRSPVLFQTPEIQFPLAALRRNVISSRAADAIMRQFISHPIDAETKELAERELWTSMITAEPPQTLAVCRLTETRPHLDGLLSDPCWEDAREIRLTDQPVNSSPGRGAADPTQTMVMFSYDEEFLFLAIRVPKVEGPPGDVPQLAGRQHDADLSRHDRVTVRLDLDRDYATWYEFQVDQRGWTTESCWEDRRWDPHWYVAAEADKSHWRIEAAIPWREMSPMAPRRGVIYGVSVLRTIPTVGLQSWSQPATTRPQPSSFGLLKFE